MTHTAIAWVVLAIFEITVPAFVFASLAAAALGAASLAAFGSSLELQLLAFVVGTVVLVVAARSFGRRAFFRGPPAVRTNVDALPGRRATVSIAIDNTRGEGWGLLDGME